MRCAVLLLVLLVAASLVAQSEGGFWSRVKRVWKRVVRFVKKCKCRYDIGTKRIHCTCKGKRSLDKRDGIDPVCSKDFDLNGVDDDFAPDQAMSKAMAQIIKDCEDELEHR